MKLDKLIGVRFKEKPTDAVIESHALMLRGGYIKQVTSGVFSSYTVMLRIMRKIEKVIREEMDAIDGQEVLFPVTMPASLWQESGRYESVGPELLRFTDRNDNPMLLGMTHEEAAVHLVREYGNSYSKYPFMVYQIQTKFRDEARPRAGLIRVREFTMKDGYSFHISQSDLEEYYKRCFHAYNRIFTRCGIPEVISVASDSGMMGGNLAHEFILLTPVGEDSIVTCRNCDYSANLEAAESIIKNEPSASNVELQKVHTPGKKTIEDVCEFLNLPTSKSCKAVVYQKSESGEPVAVFIRGDLEVNETKLRNYLCDEIHPAAQSDECRFIFGSLGPIKLKGAVILFDRSLEGNMNLCCGANEEDYHYTGFCIERDYGKTQYHDFAKALDNGICPLCRNSSLILSRGIEVGNIFQLGDKYTRIMNMTYTDENGESRYPVMGCYGIGVGRLAAAVCQARHDDYGPIWPLPIAPWQVQICCVRADNSESKALADRLYESLLKAGVEVLYDDRLVSAGVMFSDADLLGIPVRIIISPRNIKEGCCEIVTRDKKFNEKIAIDEVLTTIIDIISNS